MRPDRSDRFFLALLLGLMLLTAGGHIVVGDEETMYRVTQSLAEGRSLAVGRENLVLPAQPGGVFIPRIAMTLPTTSAVAGVDGRLYSKYGLGQSLLALPLYQVGAGAGRLFGAVPVAAGRLAVSFLNPLALAACAWLVLRLALKLGYRRATSRWLALAFAVSSMAWPYVKTFYPQPTLMLLLLSLVYVASRWRQAPSGGLAAAMAAAAAGVVLVRPSEAILLPVVAIYLCAARRPRNWRGPLSLAAGMAIGLVIAGWYNFYRFGSPLQTGYHEVAWTTPPLLGLYGLLVSPGKGAFLYTPLLVLGLGAFPLLAQRRRPEAFLLAGLWLTMLVIYAPYDFWTGGFNWGSRFLLPVVPLGLLPIGDLLDRPGRSPKLAWALFLLLFGLGTFIQLPAILVDHSRYLYQHLSGREETQAYAETIYNLPDSPLVQQWPTAMTLLSAYARPEVRAEAGRYLTFVPGDSPNRAIPNGPFLAQDEFKRQNTPDLWWVHMWLRNLAGEVPNNALPGARSGP